MCYNISVRGSLIHHRLLTHQGLVALEYLCLILEGMLSRCHPSSADSAAPVGGQEEQ